MKSIFLASLFLAGQLISLALPAGVLIQWNPSALQSSNASVVTVASQPLTNVVAVAVGRANLALKSDGTVIGLGRNIRGRTTGAETEDASGVVKVDGQVLSNVIAVSACVFSAALMHDGRVVILGPDDFGHKIGVPSDLTNAVAVNAGEDHCLVLKEDGTLISLAAEGVTRFALSNVVAMATGRSYGLGNGLTSDLALKNDGTLAGLFKGRIEKGSLSKEMTNITAIAMGGAATFLLTKDGRVFGIGINDRGQATGIKTTNYIASGYVTINGELLTNVTAIAAGGDMNLALKQDGTIAAWGGVGKFGHAAVREN